MNPFLLTFIGLLFLGIGFFSIVLARKRLQQARALGQPAVWYKNLGLLTGLEYTLLGIIIFLNLLGSQIPAQSPLRAAVDIIFAGILLLAIILLLAVVFTMLRQPRRTRQTLQAVSTVEADAHRQSPEEQAAETQRKRERRQKAAAARRRHAGRA
jgi:hypothetical protein